MKVKIGPYTNWIGPYQIAEKLLFWLDKYEDDRVHNFGTWLAEDKHGNDTWLAKLCTKLHSFKKRQEYVHIDRYDVWSMDHSLSLIIYPMLVELKKQKQSYGLIDDEDVPEHLRSTNAPAKEHDWDLDTLAEARYNWFLDELIWAFGKHTSDDEKAEFYDHTESRKVKDLWESIKLLKVDDAGLKAHEARKQHAFMLFGKYFQTLWD